MNLLIKKFPDDLHKKLKAEALKRDMRLYELVVLAIKNLWTKKQ